MAQLHSSLSHRKAAEYLSMPCSHSKMTTVALEAKKCGKQDYHRAYKIFSDPKFLPFMSPMATLCC
jgi:hypothetical protein